MKKNGSFLAFVSSWDRGILTVKKVGEREHVPVYRIETETLDAFEEGQYMRGEVVVKDTKPKSVVLNINGEQVERKVSDVERRVRRVLWLANNALQRVA